MKIYHSTGKYLGFINNDNFFSRDSVYLGWVERGIVWKNDGNYAGQIVEINGHHYILKNQFMILPIPRIPRIPPIAPIVPIPPINTIPINIPIGHIDAFNI